MNPWLWMLVGAGVILVLTFGAACVAEKDVRDSLVMVLGTFFLAPAVLFYWLHSAPKAQRLSPKALERFSRNVSADLKPAWLLSYRGNGVLVVRRRKTGGYKYWRNQPGGAAQRARKDTES